MSSAGPSSEFLSLQSAVVGRYSVERELGRGGMGIVLLARDVALDRLVAIKVLPLALAAEPELRERFLQEARTAAGLSHPNIVPIHAVEEHGDLVFFVMTFVDGETLRDRVERAGPLRLSDAVRLIEEVAWGLTLAHAKGIVHRDVKPDNIMIDKATGRAMVTDFGIARVAHAAASSSGSGELVGTAHYMSPEQAMGEEVDARSDFYSLGVTAFYALTGSLPFDAPTLPAIIGMHVSQPPPSIVSIRPNVPVRLADAVNRCLAKDPDARFQSAEDLASGIGGLGLASKDVPPLVRHFLRSVGTVVFMVPAVVLGWVWSRSDNFWFSLYMAPMVFAAPVFLAARTLARSGMSFDDVSTALTTARRLKREERESVTEDMRRGLWRVRMVLMMAGVFLIVGGVGEIVAPELGGILPWFLLPLGAGCLLLGLLPPMPRTRWFWKLAAKLENPVGRVAPRSRAAPRWLGMLAKHLGKLFFRVAGIGLKESARPPSPAIEHTEVVLAAAADSLFDDLPKEHRRRLADLPNVMRRLEGHARTLRERRDELERVLSAAKSGPVDVDGIESESTAARVFELETAARATSERLATAVAAQEQIRLDLMRLQGGVGSIEGLTGDLQAADRVSEEIDAVLEGLRQVAEVMRVTPGEGAMATTRRFRS